MLSKKSALTPRLEGAISSNGSFQHKSGGIIANNSPFESTVAPSANLQVLLRGACKCDLEEGTNFTPPSGSPEQADGESEPSGLPESAKRTLKGGRYTQGVPPMFLKVASRLPQDYLKFEKSRLTYSFL